MEIASVTVTLPNSGRFACGAVQVVMKPAQGCHHERTGTECRVHKVLADAAEQHLNNDDAEQGTESAQPQRSCNRNVECDKYARNQAGQVAYGVRVMNDFVVNGLKHKACHHCNNNMDQRTSAEGVNCNRQCRNKCDEHIEHKALVSSSALICGEEVTTTLLRS